MSQRRADPAIAVQIWETMARLESHSATKSHSLGAIENLCFQNFGVKAEVIIRELEALVTDGLLEVSTLNGEKNEQLYSIPERVVQKKITQDSHDWYCFECHKAGVVIKCTSCYRVYHEKCVTREKKNNSDFVCPMCILMSTQAQYKLKKDLNKLLAFTCQRLRYSLPVDCTTWRPSMKEMASLSSAEMDSTSKKKLFERFASRVFKKESETQAWDEWKIQALLFKNTDIGIMESRADRMVYRSLEQFQVDALSVLHNVAILYGDCSFVTESARKMYNDCVYDINEIRLCHRCYRYSNSRESEDWFCEPCNPPHELVFAKYSGYPFWSAKILKVNRDEYDVRFFGAGHSRATVRKSNTRPITTDITGLVTKKTTGWRAAYDELLKYQSRLKAGGLASSSDESTTSSPEGPASPPPRKVPRVAMRRLDFAPPKPEKTQSEPVTNGETSFSIPHVKTQHENVVIETSPATFCPACKGMVNANVEAELHLEKVKNLELSMELEKLRNEMRKQMEELANLHEQRISEVKKRQWCSVCEVEAVYHCCWNTSYCSTACQNADWNKGHKQKCSHR